MRHYAKRFTAIFTALFLVSTIGAIYHGNNPLTSITATLAGLAFLIALNEPQND